MIRLVHTLGGCGGTVLSRCLGVMPGVALLSEVNPNAVTLYPHFNPLYQDDRWLHLLSLTDRRHFSELDLTAAEHFRSLVALLYERATEVGRQLILRDFNYIDYLGVPFKLLPPRRMTIYEVLPNDIETIAMAFIRHPLDQWVSLCKHEELRPTLTPAIFCDGYLAFLNNLESVKTYKYEEFLANPEHEMKSICDHLLLPFDPSFLERFFAFDAVTGDFTRLREKTISPSAKKVISRSDLERFHNSKSYREVLNLAGYSEEKAR